MGLQKTFKGIRQKTKENSQKKLLAEESKRMGPFEGFYIFKKPEEKMREGVKIRRMTEYEIENCKKNISFYKDQISKNDKNSSFYAEQIDYMENKLEELKNHKTFCELLEISNNDL